MRTHNTVPFVLRDFDKTDKDYLGVAEVATAVWPEYPTTVSGLKDSDADRDPDLPFGRIVAELDGRIAGFGIYGQSERSHHAGKFFVHAAVHPDRRRLGAGAAIYDRMVDILSQRRPTALVASTHDNYADALGFLERRGFEIVLRRPVSRLDVQSFDSKRVPLANRAFVRDSISISALSGLMPAVADWKRRCWDLEWEIVQDIPMPDAPTRPTLERYAQLLDVPDFEPDSWFVARHGDAWVGMSTLSTDPSVPGVFFTGITGVRRGYRRRGIATALKLRGIEFVRNRGGRTIETDNEENNPMLELNLALGFERGPTLLDLRKNC